jgi:hypothetical protein
MEHLTQPLTKAGEIVRRGFCETPSLRTRFFRDRRGQSSVADAMFQLFLLRKKNLGKRKAFLCDCRGQSSVADAMFFFSIVAVLSLFLFSFGTNYGTTLRNQTDKEQFREYASSALKTILYTSTPRDPEKSLDDAQPEDEVDFLLAAAKEDYSDDGNFGDTAITIKNTVRGIMQPLSTSADYMLFFYMPTETQRQIPFFLFYRSVNNYDYSHNLFLDPERCKDSAGNTLRGCHEFWYCKPNAMDNVNTFLFSLSNFSSTNVKARFLSASPIPGQSPRQVDSEIHFVLWPSVVFNDGAGTSYIGLNCFCKADAQGSIPENQTQCFQEMFTSDSKVGGGISFEIKPNVLHFLAADSPKTVTFLVRNKSSKQIESVQIVDALANTINACTWIQGLPISIAPIAGTASPAPQKKDWVWTTGSPFIDSGYSILGENGADIPFTTANLPSIRDVLYSQAPYSYPIQLYKVGSQTVTVNKPTNSSFWPCQLELHYRFPDDDTDKDRRIPVQLSIRAEQGQ